jgi:hypothetical protein
MRFPIALVNRKEGKITRPLSPGEVLFQIKRRNLADRALQSLSRADRSRLRIFEQ